VTTSDADLDAPPVPPRAPLTTTVSIKPAASVLIIAIAMLAIFLVINGVADQGDGTAPTTIAVVGGLAVDSSSQILAKCEQAAPVPDNIATAFIVPVKTVSAGGITNQTSDAGAFDCSQPLSAPYSQNEILGFYKSELVAQGWNLFSQGAAVGGGGQQFLFQKGGDDSFYWISGVTVDHHSANSTTWTLRFYQDDALD
jgi:hypothetical protein